MGLGMRRGDVVFIVLATAAMQRACSCPRVTVFRRHGALKTHEEEAQRQTAQRKDGRCQRQAVHYELYQRKFENAAERY